MSDRQRLRGERAALAWQGYAVFAVMFLLFIGLIVAAVTGYFVFLMLVVFFVAGLFCIYLGTVFYRKSALVRNTSTERVQSIAMGQTELEGVARSAGQVFSQPFVAGECLYASWEVEEYTGSQEHADWSLVESGSLSAPFYLEDDTGTVLVDDPADATVRISDENIEEKAAGADEMPSAEIQQFCEQQGISPTSRNSRRYTQRIITSDTDIYVLGFAERLDDPEYESANDVLITDGDGEYEFLIADSGAREVARNYRNGAIIALLYGLVSGAVSLYFLISDLQSFGLL